MGFTEPLFVAFLALFAAGFTVVRWSAMPWARRPESAERARILYVALSSVGFYALWYPPGVVLLLGHGALLWVVTPSLLAGRRGALTLAVGLCLGVLGVFKYYDFFVGIFEPGYEGLGLFLPLGISFYTFTAVAYYVDLYGGRAEPVRSFSEGLLLIAFWPHLAAGPILRARDVVGEQVRHPRPTAEVCALAATMIATGLVRKLLIADNIGAYVNWNLAQGIGAMDALAAWSVVLGFGAQIYADFAGYSDMAIGFALLLGYRLPANFDLPYRATSMREFWRRWHISLSTWFRDYVYLPLGGGRRAPARVSVNLMVVFLASGLWHGAALGFVVWGALHGAFMVCERLMGDRYSRCPAWLRWGVTMFGVFVAWGFFRLDLTQAAALTRRLFAFGPLLEKGIDMSAPFAVLPVFAMLLLVAIDHACPAYVVDGEGYPARASGWSGLAVLCIALPTALVYSGSPLPFIYFDF